MTFAVDSWALNNNYLSFGNHASGKRQREEGGLLDGKEVTDHTAGPDRSCTDRGIKAAERTVLVECVKE